MSTRYPEIPEPTSPPATKHWTYFDTSDGLFKSKNSAGVVKTYAVGNPLPVGGTTGQVLSKINATDYNVQWTTPGGGVIPWTTVATSGIINAQPYFAAIRFTSSGIQLRGMVAQADGTEVVIYNASAGTINVQGENVSAAAADRFTNTSATVAVIQANQGIRYRYSTTTSRWVHVDTLPVTAQSPLSISAAGSMSMSIASASANGYLTIANFNTFNNKIGGSGAANRIPYFNGGSSVTSSANLTWNETRARVGVQVAAGTEEGALHLKSLVSVPITGPTGFSATLVEFIPLDTPSGSSTTINPGRLMNPDSPSATENSSGSSPWSAGDILTYRISPYYYDGDVTYIHSAAPTDATAVTLASSNNGVDLSWTPDNSGTQAIAGYIVYRDLNADGFASGIDVGNVSSYTDNGGGETHGAYPALPLFNDYVANGTSRDYDYYSREVTGFGTVVSGANLSPTTITDSSNGKPYRVTHNITTTASLVKIVGSVDGVSFDSEILGAQGTDIEEYADGWAVLVADPSSIGVQSDSFALNRSYYFYRSETISGVNVYSSAFVASTTDPNDSLFYYVELSGTLTASSNGSKIVQGEDNQGKNFPSGTSVTWYDFTGSGFPDSPDATPIGVVPPALIVEKAGGPTEFAHHTLKGLADYARMAFQDSGNVERGAIDSTQTEMSMKFTGTKNLRMNATTLGLYGVTPVARATTGVAAATFVAGAGTGVNDASTFDGYTLKQIVKALRNLGILT